MLKIYTDGSCINSFGGYGFVVINGEDHFDYFGKYPGVCTNQKAELYAILKAIVCIQTMFKEHISSLDKENIIEIYTDSKYAIGCLTIWYPNWLKNGWKNSKKQPVANKELIEEILLIMKGRNIKFFHVFGHKGNFYNELADKLADQGRNCKITF